MSRVTLTCMVNPTPSSSVTYQWNTTGCYTNSKFTGNNPQCFPHGQTTQSVTGNDLNAEDAGTITCTVTISGSDYTSEPFTLRISGEQLVYCIITCIVYCKQCMLLLLATYYCYIIHQLLWFMYRSVFTLGVVVTRGFTVAQTNILTDYSYVTAKDGTGDGVWLVRCLTGLGPSDNDSGVLGGLYFNGNRIPNGPICSSEGIIQPALEILTAGVTNVHQCEAFSTSVEGIYTCTMMNSSMMNELIRFGIYFAGRSESFDISIYSIT